MQVEKEGPRLDVFAGDLVAGQGALAFYDASWRKKYLMRFFVLMRGAMTPPPRMLLPVMKMPLQVQIIY